MADGERAIRDAFDGAPEYRPPARTDYERKAAKIKSAAEPLTILEPIRWHGKPIPAREWLIENVIPRRNVTTLNGPGGIGKSTVLLQMLICAAIGRDWLGFPVRQCKAFGVFCEDDEDELHRRTAAIAEHYGVDLGDLENLQLVSRVGMMNTMMMFENRYSPGEETAFYSGVLNRSLDFGAELLVIDSRYDVFPGDQIDTTQVHQFVGSLRTIANEINGSVVLASHPSRAGMATGDGESGSVAWHNAVRARYYLRAGDEDKDGTGGLILEAMKSNYGPKFEPLPLRWDSGAFLPDRPAGGTIGSIQKNVAKKVFLECVDAALAQGRAFSDSKQAGGKYAPKAMMSMPQARGLTKQQLETAMAALFDQGAIVVGFPPLDPKENRHKVRGIMRNPQHTMLDDPDED